jgi:hypothetical protein
MIRVRLPAPIEEDTIAALEQLKKAVRIAFYGVMQSNQLPPMAALSLAAAAVGSLYHEVARAHRGDDACPCGWKPRDAADLEALQTSLALATERPRVELHALEVVGNA